MSIEDIMDMISAGELLQWKFNSYT
jgi:hypothetical protein